MIIKNIKERLEPLMLLIAFTLSHFLYIGERQRQQQIQKAATEVGPHPTSESIERTAKDFEKFGVTTADIERRRGEIDEPKEKDIIGTGTRRKVVPTGELTAKGKPVFRAATPEEGVKVSVKKAQKPTTREEFARSLFERQKKIVRETQEGLTIIEGKRKTVITPTGEIVDVPITARVQPKFVRQLIRERRVPPKLISKPEAVRDFKLISEIRAAPQPKGTLERLGRFLDVRRERTRIATARGVFGAQVKGVGIGVGISLVGSAAFFRSLGTQPITTIKQTGRSLRTIGGKIITGKGFPGLGQKLFEEPGIAVGFVGAEIAQARIGGKIIKRTTTGLKRVATRLSPKFKPVTKTLLGEKVILAKEPVGLIPPGDRPILKPESLLFAKEFPPSLKKVPRLPKLTKVQRKILAVTKETKGVVTGSLAERVLVESKTVRRFGDIDILVKSPKAVAAKLKVALGPSVKIKKVKIKGSPLGEFDIFRVIKKRTGRVIADIDPIKFAEEGFIKKFPITEVGGIRFVSPKARLAAKVTQFGRGKRGKVLTDIETLTGGKVDIKAAAKSPLVRGAFGFTRKEQAKFIGVRGTVATSARDLFKPFKPKVVVGEGGLFASPPELRTKIAVTRVSRLALGSREATLTDILAGDITFKRAKPQIILFPDVEIGKEFKPFGLPSSELEVLLRPGAVIKKQKKIAVTLIEGERVPIITAKVLKQVKPPGKAMAPIRRITGKATRDIIERELGISKRVTPRPFVSPVRLAVSGVSLTKAVTKPIKITKPTIKPIRISRAISIKPSRRISLTRVIFPSRAVSLLPISPISVLPSKPPSRPPSFRPSRPPSRPPSIPPLVLPSFPPSLPPSRPPSRPPLIPPSLPPPGITPLIFPSFPGFPERKKKKSVRGFKPLRFMPSLVPVAKELYGAKPKFLTGLEPRFLQAF